MISVVIPTRNEARELPRSLACLVHLATGDGAPEVLVVDGSSSDDTVSVARAFGANVSSSPRRQRAAQMNLGAARATGEVLLFLHADTQVPPAAGAMIQCALREPRVVGGGFHRRFEPGSRGLEWWSRAGALRARWSGWFFGDQAIFVRTRIFRETGGFQDLDLFEEVDLCRRLKRRGKLALLPGMVTTSARRFETGGRYRTMALDAWLTLRYALGASPHRLAATLRRFRSGTAHRSEADPA
ncbi:MAG: TIGR04283 family arsenosugar biosynthesis glycosyltransferase [Verrucomicrobiales bacterium]|nr:TIGR04283 family arsenosugar biosynthesis glycosyltransferase [Verrucomicrobiales bacterium]